MRRLTTTCVATLLLAACSGGPDATDDADAPAPRDEEAASSAEACEQAFARAAAGDGELEAALTACEDIATLTQAATDHPEALGDVEPQVWLAEACTEADEPAITESALCAEVAGEEQG